MIDIVVQRGAGDKQGPDIVDPLLSSIGVAIARGTHEINISTSVDVITLRAVYRSGVSVGDLAEVHDALQGVSWRGRIVGLTHNVIGVEVWTQIILERAT